MLLPFLLCVLVLYVPLPAGQALPWPLAVGGALGLALVNAAACWVGADLAVRHARRGPGAGAAQVFAVLRGGIVGLCVVLVFGLKWPLLVEQAFARWRWAVVLDDLLLLAPVLVMAGTQVASRYRYETRRGHAALSLAGYLWLRFRVEIAIVLAPWLLLVCATDVTAAALADSPSLPLIDTLATGAVLGVLVVGSPLLMRTIWTTSPLRDGTLRNRLLDFARAHRFRCRDILVWHTHNHLANAGVVGPTPLIRYVMLSDVLLNRCTHDEVEAIFAHEVAHIRCHHLLFYLLFAGAFIAFQAVLIELLAALGIVAPLGSLLALDMSVGQGVAMLLFAGLYWGFGFGYMSRRMEQQADLVAARSVADPMALVMALEKLGAMSSAPRRASFWRHFSVERRIRFITRMMWNPELAVRVVFRLRLMRAGFLAAFVGAAAWILLARPGLLAI